MTVTVFFAAGADLWDEYKAPLQHALADLGVRAFLTDTAPDPAAVDYMIISPGGIVSDFTPYTRCKAVLNLWAGVERLVGNATLTQPLTRMVIDGMTESMVEYVVGNVLRYHLGLDRHIVNPARVWAPEPAPPNARDRAVTILGLGELGTACARALVALNFRLTGWSRSARDVPGVRCLSGVAGLDAALSGAEIVVLLLPLTNDTRDILNGERLSRMAPGAFVINAGRGPLIDDDALLAALDSGQVAGATLDVFRVEPLPDGHPYWHHPRVTVTPHVAAKTPVEESCRMVAENIRRGQAGEAFLHLVDRSRGY